MKLVLVFIIACILNSIGLNVSSTIPYLYPTTFLLFLFAFHYYLEDEKLCFYLWMIFALCYDFLFAPIFGITIFSYLILYFFITYYKKKAPCNLFFYLGGNILAWILYSGTVFLFLNIIGYFKIPLLLYCKQTLNSFVSTILFASFCYFFLYYRRNLQMKKSVNKKR